ncbi:MAG TPA: hypothetical protein VEI04_12675 [Syntrophobacteria bacterium]|nr:hypothetical protein [Syntrophobacteria bacterium]
MPVPRDEDGLGEEQQDEIYLEEEDEEFAEDELDVEEDVEATEEPGVRRGPSLPRTVDFSEEDFRAKLGAADSSTAKPYIMTRDYSPGELILHPQFGVGIIAAILGPKKIQVVFQENSKVLVMNYTPSR